MFFEVSIIISASILTGDASLWLCTSDENCSTLVGSHCVDGDCLCPTGQEPALSGTLCLEVLPYLTSPCGSDNHCSRLFSGFECRRNIIENDPGSCQCQSGHHYFGGRCWPSRAFGAACSRDEECMGVIRDPYHMACDEGNCACAEGYYLRQREECRKEGTAVGEECVVDEDCRFEGGACDIMTLTCYNINDEEDENEMKSGFLNVEVSKVPANFSVVSRNQHSEVCASNNDCAEPLVCFTNKCVCPRGYYFDANICLAELSSPSTEEECVGVFSRVEGGVCRCPANFYYDEDMRDCVKVVRVRTDTCSSDLMCHTFGAHARCGAPTEPWGFRYCECDIEHTVWDEARQICRLFAGVGESCEVDSDCLAGELEIVCVHEEADSPGYCACPEDYEIFEGLCITRGLELGDVCQVTEECIETPNSICKNGVCSCEEGYQESDGQCAPALGSVCEHDTDCFIENSVCVDDSDVLTCQCNEAFVNYEDECWPKVPGFNSSCNVTTQCIESGLGAGSVCDTEGYCICDERHHHIEEFCWPALSLFEACTNVNECYLGDITERVVCRNGLCQCDFDYYYDEILNTCVSSASSTFGSAIIVTISSITLFILIHK